MMMELQEAHTANVAKPGAPHITTSASNEEASVPVAKVEKKATTAIIISTIAGVTMISSLLSGLVTISLPTMARDLDIPEALLLWYVTFRSGSDTTNDILKAFIHLFADMWMHSYSLRCCC